jgi:hypothetical protein
MQIMLKIQKQSEKIYSGGYNSWMLLYLRTNDVLIYGQIYLSTNSVFGLEKVDQWKTNRTSTTGSKYRPV